MKEKKNSVASTERILLSFCVPWSIPRGGGVSKKTFLFFFSGKVTKEKDLNSSSSGIYVDFESFVH
jgi:hypothetical protein